jgi:hypothetical protein
MHLRAGPAHSAAMNIARKNSEIEKSDFIILQFLFLLCEIWEAFRSVLLNYEDFYLLDLPLFNRRTCMYLLVLRFAGCRHDAGSSRCFVWRQAKMWDTIASTPIPTSIKIQLLLT